MKKKILIIFLVLWSLAITTPAAASPLYAGYNGQSLFWVDTFFFGIDNQARWWVRLPLDILQGAVRIIFKFESTGALSTEVVVYGITGQGDLLFGFDTEGQSWGESYQTGFVTGYDNSGATWTEQDAFDFVGTGADNFDNTWWFVSFNYQNVFPVSAGMNISLLIPEVPVEEESVVGEQKKQGSSAGLPSGEHMGKIVGYLKEIARDDELMEKLKLLTSTSLDPASLLKFAGEEVFPPERRTVLERMMGDTLD